MKRLINSTTILSMALYIVPPFAAQAQDFPTVTIEGKEVICLPDKKAECPEGAFCVVVKNPKNCEARATEAIAAAAAAEAAGGTADADKAAADQAAADQAAADQAAADQAAADKAAADAAAAAADADKAAADQAAADADRAAADKAAADQAAADADKAAADKAAADQAAADKATAAADKAAAKADKAAADQAAADKEAADKAAKKAARADAAAKADAAANADAAAKADADATAGADAAAASGATNFPKVTVDGESFVCLPDRDTACPDGDICVVAKNPANCEVKATEKLAKMNAAETPGPIPVEDAAAVAAAQKAAAAAAAAVDPNAETVTAPIPTADAVTTLETALDGFDPETNDTPAAAQGNATPTNAPPVQAPAAPGVTVTTIVVNENDNRASDEEFKAAPTTVAPGKKTGLSDFEKVGLVALGALAIGAMINGNKQVVQNTGDRVVVRQPDGTYQVYKDDNALLSEPGSTVRTETYRDGSTRTIVTRADKSQIVTIRDATGRVLQRVVYDPSGRPTVLIDDLQPERAVDVTTLPRPQPSRNQISVDDSDADMRAQLAAAAAADIGRTFSLRQIRNIAEVRYLAATIDVNNITFATGSSAIQGTEARKLDRLGKLMTRMIKENPNEVFLVEGHTDAVGSAASNLSLSDRRAESVAKALTEYFDVAPENLVVQGYGESELKVPSQGDERDNRRVAVRIITPLLSQ